VISLGSLRLVSYEPKFSFTTNWRDKLQVESKTNYCELCSLRQHAAATRQKARLKEAGHAQPQLLLPRSEVKRAIELCHAGSVGGHFGIEKTLKQVERRFYWVGWKDDVRRFCRSCEQCSKYHRGKLPKQGALQPVLPDIIYGAPIEASEQDYDRFVEQTRDRATQAYYDVRVSLQKRAQRNKKYYDLGLKGAEFNEGDWVLYFNPRKLRGKPMKWVRQYEGPFLIVAKPTKFTAKIQRSAKAQIRVVHVDKLKKFVGKTPKAWKLPAASEQIGQTVERGTRLAGSPSTGKSPGEVQAGAENSSLPVGAVDSSIGMPGVDSFSLTPSVYGSVLPYDEDRQDSESSEFARHEIRAEVHNEMGSNPPNGQASSVVYESFGSEPLTEQPELGMLSEQGGRLDGISPLAVEQRGSFAP